MQKNSCILLTGATGLLGRYLLRDLSLQGVRVAVLVRDGVTAGADGRVEGLIRDWREVARVDVPRPVVLPGDIRSPGLGLSPADLEWIEANVGEVVHAAASLAFGRRESDDEPYASNVGGTANVLDLCRSAGIRRLHHVSTAYVCGRRRGHVLETELDVGQEPGNDYERSKIEAERAVRAADWLDVRTVHRPSIIVGDLVHGFTTTFHGFYKPLRIMQPFVASFLQASLEAGRLLDVLGMDGRERKNLVPVDWVSAVMTRIILDPSLHGGTYHLTSTRPTSVDLLCRVFAEMLVEMGEQTKATGSSRPSSVLDPELLARLFGDQMDVYRAYWRDDPEFDVTATTRAAPDLPAPVMSEATLRRLCRFAISTGFRWPPVEGHALRPA
jgi:thioester reductase-like protein